jgi:hypothetical protein
MQRFCRISVNSALREVLDPQIFLVFATTFEFIQRHIFIFLTKTSVTRYVLRSIEGVSFQDTILLSRLELINYSSLQ